MRSVSSLRAAGSAVITSTARAFSPARCQRKNAAMSVPMSASFVVVVGGRAARLTSSLSLSPSRRLVSARANAEDADAELAGQITAELMESMRAKIAAALEADPASVRVADASGDGRHVEIDVVARAFEGKKSMERQRMVYKAIWQELAETVHAVDAMTTKTPAEAAGQ